MTDPAHPEITDAVVEALLKEAFPGSALVSAPAAPILDTKISDKTKAALAEIDKAVRHGAANAHNLFVGAATAAEAEPAGWVYRLKGAKSWHFYEGSDRMFTAPEQDDAYEQRPLYAAPSASQEALREAAYDRGRRDMLNALLVPNPPIEAKLAHWADKAPDPEGRIHFDVALWITEVATQLGIKSQEELAEGAALAQSAAPVKPEKE
jgi:hypothetical protein